MKIIASILLIIVCFLAFLGIRSNLQSPRAIFRGPQRPGTRYLQYNPPAASIEYVVSRWLPVFFYIANRTITDADDLPLFRAIQN